MTDAIVVMCTFPNEEALRPVLETVFVKKLAACVQTMAVSSHYVWEGELCHDPEILTYFKTAKACYPELEKLILELHPYEVPEVIAVDITEGSSAYLRWIGVETKTDA